MGKFWCWKHFHECGGLKKRISNNVQTLDSFYVFNYPAFPILMQTERPKTYRIKVDWRHPIPRSIYYYSSNWFVVFAPNNEYILESGIQRLAYARYSRLLNILNALRIWLFTELMMFVHAINVNKLVYFTLL